MRINLLPKRVHAKKAVGAAWATVAAILILELVALSFWQSSLLAKERSMEQDVKAKEAEAQAVTQIGQDAATERSKIASIQGKVDFVKKLQEYNRQRPELYGNTAEYTLRGIHYTSMSASQNYLQIAAWAPTLSDAGRYLLAMQNSPDFSYVQISAVPGYPPGTQSAAGGGGGPGEGGMPMGPSSGMGGPMGSGGMGPGGPPGGPMPGGPAGGPMPGGMGSMPPGGEAGGPMPGGPGGAMAMGGPGGPGGGGGGNSLTGGAFQGLGARGMPPKPPQGFGFTVTAQLVKPIMRPMYGQQPQGLGGGFGGAMGPGMMPGMMPGGGPAGAMGPEAGAGAPGGPGLRRRGGAMAE